MKIEKLQFLNTHSAYLYGNNLKTTENPREPIYLADITQNRPFKRDCDPTRVRFTLKMKYPPSPCQSKHTAMSLAKGRKSLDCDTAGECGF